jgi:hypothetical protein
LRNTFEDDFGEVSAWEGYEYNLMWRSAGNYVWQDLRLLLTLGWIENLKQTQTTHPLLEAKGCIKIMQSCFICAL